MRAAVEDVHHRHRQQVRVGAADVAVERQVRAVRGGPGDGERDAEDRVGAELGLVGRAVELEHRLVDQPLVVGLEALDRRGDVLDDGLDGLLHALAEVALAAVAQLDRLEGAGGRAAGHRGAGERAVVEGDLDLDGGVAARVEDLAGADSCDGCHGVAPGGGKRTGSSSLDRPDGDSREQSRAGPAPTGTGRAPVREVRSNRRVQRPPAAAAGPSWPKVHLREHWSTRRVGRAGTLDGGRAMSLHCPRWWMQSRDPRWSSRLRSNRVETSPTHCTLRVAGGSGSDSG